MTCGMRTQANAGFAGMAMVIGGIALIQVRRPGI